MKTFTKRVSDTIANAAKRLEEAWDREPTILEGFRRSLQLDGYTCGAQSVYMILSYYGKARSISAVTKALGTTTDGTDQYQIRDLLTKRGLIVRRLKRPAIGQLRDAVKQGCPVLVSVDDGEHWAVVYGFSKGSIYLADPSMRVIRCRCATRDFLRRWDRWAMVVEKTTRMRAGK